MDHVEILKAITHFDQEIENVHRLLVARKQGKDVSDITVRKIASRLHEKIAMVQEMLILSAESNHTDFIAELSAIEDQLMESLRLVYGAENTETRFH